MSRHFCILSWTLCIYAVTHWDAGANDFCALVLGSAQKQMLLVTPQRAGS